MISFWKSVSNTLGKQNAAPGTLFNASFPDKIKAFPDMRFLKGDAGDTTFDHGGLGQDFSMPKPFIFGGTQPFLRRAQNSAVFQFSYALSPFPTLENLVSNQPKFDLRVDKLKVLVGDETLTKVKRFSPFKPGTNEPRLSFQGAKFVVDLSGEEPLFVKYLKKVSVDENAFVQLTKSYAELLDLMTTKLLIRAKTTEDRNSKRAATETKIQDLLNQFPALNTGGVEFTVIDQMMPYFICPSYQNPEQIDCGGVQTGPGSLLGDFKVYVEEIVDNSELLVQQLKDANRNKLIIYSLLGISAVGAGVYFYRKRKNQSSGV